MNERSTELLFPFTLLTRCDSLFNVIQGGHELYASVFSSVHEVVITLVILLWGEIKYHATMRELGLIFVVSETVFFVANVIIIARAGWWRKYYSGMIQGFALKVSIERKILFHSSYV